MASGHSIVGVQAWGTRLLGSPFIIRVPFFLLFGFNKGTLNQKGNRVLLRNLGHTNPERESLMIIVRSPKD